jgi:ribosomal protein S18 acetylase RimI-like enzyme
MISIVSYQPGHQTYFERFNKAWIEKHFWLEDIDRYVLENPSESIISTGGTILIAEYDGVVAGTVALKKVDNDTYEFTKMAVDESFRRKGIARALSHAAFEKARQLGAGRVILYSNTTLDGAIIMYRKLGFKEVPIEQGVYQRSDIKMEILLENIPQLQNHQTWK